MKNRNRVLALAWVITLVAAPSLAAQRPATAELVWPPPPEEPRIRYVGSLSSERDIGREESFLGKLKRSLVGGSGPRMIQVERPFDVHVAAGERYYFTNGLLDAVVLFDKAAKEARLLGEDVPGGMRKPMGLSGDAEGNVYVADPSMRRVVVFGPDGRFVRAFGGSSALLNPVDVAVDDVANRIYVVDSYLHQVVVFDREGGVIDRIGKRSRRVVSQNGPSADGYESSSGPPVANGSTDGDGAVSVAHEMFGGEEPSDVWRNRGGGEGEFRYPVSAAVGPDGTLYVSDQMNFRVQAFDREGRFVRQFGRLGVYPGSFARPKGVAVDGGGHVYVVDAAFNNVQVFHPDGKLLIAFGSLGHGEGEHWLPLGISIDESDRIYVADRFNNRAQIYEYLPSEAEIRKEVVAGPALSGRGAPEEW